jgi:uncharacterized protein (TIGR03437 family)
MRAASTCYRLLAATVFAILAIQSTAGTNTRLTPRPAENPVNQPARATLRRDYGNLPLGFEPNVGQTDAQVRFLARGAGMMAFFTDTETAMVLSRSRHANKPAGLGREEAPAGEVEQTVVRMKLEKASRPRRAVGLEKLPGISNYFIGSDSAKWRTNVPQYARLQYEGVYPGIDLVWYGNQRRLEYDFVVAPGADPKQIQVAYEGVESLGVEANGDLVLRTALGEVRQQRPRVFQECGGRQVEVAAQYAIVAPNRVSFELAMYDRQRELRIDPVVLAYSTYLGGSGTDSGYGIALDGSGSAYVTGSAASADFPTKSPYQGAYRGGTSDVFVTKLAPAGNALVYSTYLGGGGSERGTGISVDGSGSAYVAGWTTSTDFPTSMAYQGAYQGGYYDAFATKLAPAGNALVYSTYLGGSGADAGAGIALDGAGSAYVTGFTNSTNFPTQLPNQAAFHGGTYDAFATKLAPAGNTLVYSTYLGGSGDDFGYGIAVDGAGSAYVTGSTNSTDFPTQSPYQTYQGNIDIVVTKLAPAGNALLYSTYLGGSSDDFGYAIAVDGAGSAYVTGSTASTNFPTRSPYQSASNGESDAFATKLAPAGNALLYSTYLGGVRNDYGFGIAVDGAGSAYVTGGTASADFPTQSPYQSYQGGPDVFAIKLTLTGNALAYSTCLGGSGVDSGFAIAVDGAGAAYLTGQTFSSDFGVQSPYQATVHGAENAFVAKLWGPSMLTVAKTHAGNFAQGQAGVTYKVTVSNAASGGPTNGAVTVTEAPPSGLTLVSMTGAGWACPAGGPVCARSDVLAAGGSYPAITVTMNVSATAPSQVTNQVTLSGGGASAGQAKDPAVIEALAISGPSSLPAGQVGVAYAATTVTAAGGSGSYAWSATGLPAGLGIGAATGIIAGTPTTNSGNPYTVQVTVADGNSAKATRSYSLTIGAAPANLPLINGVSNAASGQAAIAPNTWVSIYGSNFAAAGFSDDWSKSILNGNLPTTLDGVSVSVGGSPAYVSFVSPGQINVLTPNVASGSASVTVTTAIGTAAAVTVASQQFSPAFFPWPNGQPVATHLDYTWAVRNGTFAGATTVPAKPGEYIILWGTGFGPTTPTAPSGVTIPASTTYYAANSVYVTIGNVSVSVYGTALASGFAGLYQVVAMVPATLSNGDYPLVATVGGVTTAATTLTVHN